MKSTTFSSNEDFNDIFDTTPEFKTSNWLNFNANTGVLMLNKEPIEQKQVLLHGVALRYNIGNAKIKPSYEYIFEFLTKINGTTEIVRLSLSNERKMLVNKFLVAFTEADEKKLYVLKPQKGVVSEKNPSGYSNLHLLDATTFKLPETKTLFEKGEFVCFPKCSEVSTELKQARLKYFAEQTYFVWYGEKISKEELSRLKVCALEGNPFQIGKPEPKNELPAASDTPPAEAIGDDLPF